MFRLTGLVIVVLTSAALADSSPPPPSDPPAPPPASAPAASPPAPTPAPHAIAGSHGKVSLRVVRILPESGQALLFDKVRNTHVVVEVGSDVAGYTVLAIDDDSITLKVNATTQIVLPAPESASETKPESKPESRPATTPRAEPAPGISPNAPASASAPEDPYADSAESSAAVTSKPATRDAPAGPSAPVGPTPSPAPRAAQPRTVGPMAATDPLADSFAQALADDPTAGPPDTRTPDGRTPDARTPDGAASNDVVLTRGEVEEATASFGVLASSIEAVFTPKGARIDAVAQGSLFARAGLRAGDIVTAVNGKPLRTLDDAADLYAFGATARNLVVKVIRGGKPTTLRIAIEIAAR